MGGPVELEDLSSYMDTAENVEEPTEFDPTNENGAQETEMPSDIPDQPAKAEPKVETSAPAAQPEPAKVEPPKTESTKTVRHRR